MFCLKSETAFFFLSVLMTIKTNPLSTGEPVCMAWVYHIPCSALPACIVISCDRALECPLLSLSHFSFIHSFSAAIDMKWIDSLPLGRSAANSFRLRLHAHQAIHCPYSTCFLKNRIFQKSAWESAQCYECWKRGWEPTGECICWRGPKNVLFFVAICFCLWSMVVRYNITSCMPIHTPH